MTTLEMTRLKIDDNLTEAYEEAVSDGEKFLYELDFHPVQDAVVKYGNDVKEEDVDYVLNKRTGQVKLIDSSDPESQIGKPENAEVIIKISYKYASFLDEDISLVLEQNNDDPVGAAIACVRMLLSSAARRFDYQQGHTRMSPSQVFTHLKDLLTMLQDEDGGAGNNVAFGSRSHGPIDSIINSDLSRTDDLINKWDRDV